MAQKTIRLAHLNAGSLVKHFHEVKDTLLTGFYDFIGITETWLTNDISDEMITVEGYHILRADRGTRGGGVAVYCNNHIKNHIKSY